MKNKKIGRLNVIESIIKFSGNRNRTFWKCKCDCGKIVEIEHYKLKSEHTRSCGCLQSELTIKRNTIHDLSKTRIYKGYHSMKNRCYNITTKDYKWYGAKGVKVCEEWLSDFMIFHDWAMNNGYKDNLTLDRIKPNGNYEPNNCQWITISEQQSKRRDCNFIEFNGKTYSMKQLSDFTGIKHNTLRAKYNKLNHNHKEFINYINKKLLKRVMSNRRRRRENEEIEF